MFKFLIVIKVLLLFAIQCGAPKEADPSKPKFLESNDWFQQGVDRFYLAYADVQVAISDDHPKIKGGNSFLFGIGCYNEPEDPETLVYVPSSHTGDSYMQIALKNREKLHHFKEPLQSGQCEVLLGNEDKGMLILDNEFNRAQSGKNQIYWSNLRLSAVCGALAAPLLAVSLWNDGGIALDFKEALKNIENVKSNVKKMTVSKRVGAGLFMSSFVLPYFASASWCGDSISDRIKVGMDFINQSNRSRIFRYFSEAEKYADQKLSSDQDKTTSYLKALANGEFEIATGIYNPIFVRAFNRQVRGTFEQGWSIGRKSTKFFDSVQTLQTEMNREFGKNFHSEGRIPANYLQCNEAQLERCVDSGVMNFSCFRKTCLNLKDLLGSVEEKKKVDAR